MKYDFSGWATKNDLRCSDGRIIRRDAFKENDGKTVPLVWNHDHADPTNVLGHALLENREDGVYAYGVFNETENAQHAKALVQHGDINMMSIYANRLQQSGSGDVYHGAIREVSLVYASANPGAYIESVLAHGEEIEDAAVIYTGEEFELYHGDDFDNGKENKMPNKNKEKTVGDVFDELTEEQKSAVYFMIGKALEDAEGESAKHSDIDDEDEGGLEMKHNIFDKETETPENTLSHSEMETILGDAKRYGSVKESFLAHAQEYGIQNLEYLFPEARNLNNPPEFIKRDTNWVGKVMSGVHKSPFSRIKSMFADITGDEARAKGYIKGNLKKEEVFSLLKRTTTPTTIYKKQKMDRDDVIDITDFDVVAWLKSEMRLMLDEEIARAVLIGDGRLASSDDKINEQNIRPIYNDAELYTIQAPVQVKQTATSEDIAREFIRKAIKARKDYKGSGQPTLFTTEDLITDILLLTDTTGRDLYESVEKIKTKLRVKDIVIVPVMEGMKGKDSNPLMGLIVNLNDYNMGADKGGSINMFDDFDIDYNQMKYLIETRCSGALTKPYSAIAFTLDKSLS